MIRVDVFEKLSEDHKFSFGDRTKQKIYNIMKDWVETYYRTGEPLFTCLILKYYCKVDEEILKGYNNYLINSEYFEEFTHSTIRVTVSDYDQFGKLRMFREFLERYEGGRFEMTLLIKYENRKIYSRDANRYVSQQEIIEAVKDGERIKIVEHKTNRDVTDEVLNQAMLRYNPLSLEQIYSILSK